MRTVSFSNNDVRRLLKKDFVNTFSNTTGDPTAGKSIWHDPDDLPGSCARGVGGQNVQTLFMTPKGEIFHAANGFLSPDDLLEEIQFARDLFAEMGNSAGAVNEVVRRAHRNRLKELGYDNSQIEAAVSDRPLGTFGMMTEIEPGDIFAGKTKREILMGNAFSIKHPMMDYRKFEKDPTPLVGKGKSAFVSTRSDGVTPERRSTNQDDSPDGKESDNRALDLPRGIPILPDGFPKNQ
ncbi:MAG: hypothetical protein ABF391_13525 [Akkermansiaceae bacterium]